MTMVEKVARAMAGDEWNAKDFTETPNGEDPEDTRAYWCDKARTAIEAMREPTNYQAKAGVDADDGRTGFQTCRHIYDAMLTAALNENPPAPARGTVERTARPGRRMTARGFPSPGMG